MSLQNAIDLAGSQTKLARILGVKRQHVTNWLNARVPAERCHAIVEATGGLSVEVTLNSLRPDLWRE